MTGNVTEPVLVIGAGPAGMVTVASLRRRGVCVRHVDRAGVIGGAYARLYGDIALTSPSRFIGLPGLPFKPTGVYVAVSEYRAYLRHYAQAYGMTPVSAWIQRIDPIDGGYRVHARQPDGALDVRVYRFVVVATGMFDYPRRPVIPGLPEEGTSTSERPMVFHAASFRGAKTLVGQRVLIVGGASSAVEIAEMCAHDGVRVVVSARGGRVNAHAQKILSVDLIGLLYPILHRMSNSINRAMSERAVTVPGVAISFHRHRTRGLIEVRSPVVGFSGKTAMFQEHPPASFDAVILATGYRHAMPFLPRDIARTRAGYPRCHRGESVSHHGLFFVGVPYAFQLTSQYLYGMARDGPRVAESIRARL